MPMMSRCLCLSFVAVQKVTCWQILLLQLGRDLALKIRDRDRDHRLEVIYRDDVMMTSSVGRDDG